MMSGSPSLLRDPRSCCVPFVLHQVERLTDAIYSAVAAFSPAERLEDDATVVIVRAKEI
jgi:hypothetical protein